MEKRLLHVLVTPKVVKIPCFSRPENGKILYIQNNISLKLNIFFSFRILLAESIKLSKDNNSVNL